MDLAQYRVWSPADGEEEGGAESFGEDSAADAAESFAAAYDFDGVNEVSVLVRCPDGSLAEAADVHQHEVRVLEMAGEPRHRDDDALVRPRLRRATGHGSKPDHKREQQSDSTHGMPPRGRDCWRLSFSLPTPESTACPSSV